MRIRKRSIISALMCLILIIVVTITYFREKKEELQYNEQSEYSEAELTDTSRVTVDGIEYKRNMDVDTVLFLGIDKNAVADLDNVPGENGQSDSINLLVYDKETKKAEIVQISRDTMVDIELYYPDGEFYKKLPAQITLQYAFGDGKNFSCRLTAERVSELMYGVEVDDYFALTLDGMSYVADALGGISIEIPEDYTDIDPAFKKGETVVLDAELTERYVRSRDQSDMEGNNLRMQRQAQFMEALFRQLQTIEDENLLVSIFEELKPYVVTNLTTEEMRKMAKYDFSKSISAIEGEVKAVDNRLQFHVDNKKLQQKVLDLFYKQI